VQARTVKSKENSQNEALANIIYKYTGQKDNTYLMEDGDTLSEAASDRMTSSMKSSQITAAY